MPHQHLHPWRTDPLLRQGFHPQYPDDLQVIAHDGGPRLATTAPELVWVTVVGKEDDGYRGKVLNQPQGLLSVKLGDEIQFQAVADQQYPFQVRKAYLNEREKW